MRAAPLYEVFSSIQGEATRVGERHLFVRLAGCDLECAFCDTPASRRIPDRARVFLPGGPEEVENPLDRAATVAVVGPGGRRSPASPEDARRLRTSALVMAASLLPAEPVAVGESWKRGRDLRALADAGIRVRGMVPELEVVEGRETVPVAVVTCRSDLTSRAGPTAGADAVMRERVRFVLGERRISAYHLRREGQTPAAAGRPARWHLVSVDLSVTPVE